jgi:DMSO reductase anchor subunit
MHPAGSIVLFTVSAGTGYGLLFLVALAVPLGLLAQLPPWLGIVALGLSLGLIVLGLASSTFHLGHPERAWRALSQWRSSWLSREGVMALATFLPALAFAYGWIVERETGGLWAAAGMLAAAGAALTVVCTAMIYASLEPVRQWRHPLVLPLYLLFALAAGGLWLCPITAAGGDAGGWPALAMIALVAAWGLKLWYWRAVDRPDDTAPSIGSATGLGSLGHVRLLDPPHTEENYLLREMGFRVARKHARKLRRIAVTLGLVLPGLLLLLGALTQGPGGAVAFALAALAGTLGLLVERWLFFAEAKHTVMLYYGD